jgi:hypothetical protein
MASLSDADLLAIMGPDYKRKMDSSAEVDVNSSKEEHAASRARRANKLADMRFSCAAVMFTGGALIGGALYTKAGIGSVQGLLGSAAVLLAIVGLVIINSKRQAILREADAMSRT